MFPVVEEKILPYVYDFLSVAFDKGVRTRKIILFGSAARGNMRPESDIDIFFDIDNAKEAERLLEKALYEFETIARTRWWPRRIKYPIKPIAGRLSGTEWDALRHDIVGHGVTLFGPYEELPKNMGQYSLFTYDISRVSPAKKVFVLRQLFGYSSVKRGKEYRSKGLVDAAGGTRISKNSILVPAQGTNDFFDFFRKNKVQAQIREVWMRKE